MDIRPHLLDHPCFSSASDARGVRSYRLSAALSRDTVLRETFKIRRVVRTCHTPLLHAPRSNGRGVLSSIPAPRPGPPPCGEKKKNAYVIGIRVARDTRLLHALAAIADAKILRKACPVTLYDPRSIELWITPLKYCDGYRWAADVLGQHYRSERFTFASSGAKRARGVLEAKVGGVMW